MVKSIQLRVDDDVHEKLVELKGAKTWLQFLVDPVLEKAEN